MIFIKVLQKIMKLVWILQNHESHRPLPKGENKNVIALMKDELGGKIMAKFFGLRAKTYSYLRDDGSEDRKAKDTKRCAIKGKLKIEN